MTDHPCLRDDLRVIVLDTNAMPGRSLNMTTLRELPKMMSKFPDLEIWIPEPVTWEWARLDHGDLAHGHSERLRSEWLPHRWGYQFGDLADIAGIDGDHQTPNHYTLCPPTPVADAAVETFVETLHVSVLCILGVPGAQVIDQSMSCARSGGCAHF